MTSYHSAMVYDMLFGVNDKFEPQPQMVSKYGVSDDRKTYTFELRDGLKFSDGTPVTARDCVASVRRWGARDGGGMSIGLMPGRDRAAGTPEHTYLLPTGLGELRNGLLVRAADAVVAVGCSWGTLSEIALSRRTGVPLVLVDPWELPADVGTVAVDADAAVAALEELPDP